jgi:hypothetical protein
MPEPIRPDRAVLWVRRALLVISSGTFVVGLLMALFSPPACSPVAATAGVMHCETGWGVGVGIGLMVVSATWILAMLFPLPPKASGDHA